MHEEQFGNNDHNALIQEERERRFDALRESRTIKEAARRLGLKRDTLGAWSRTHYEDHAEDFAGNGRNALSQEERERRLEVLRDSSTVAEAARHLDINYRALCAWSRNNYEDHDDDFVDYGNRRTSKAEERGLMEVRMELLGAMSTLGGDEV